MRLKSYRNKVVVANLTLKKLKNGDVELEYLWVEPKYRKQGIASKLLKSAISMANKKMVGLVAFIEPHKESSLTYDQEVEWLRRNGFKKIKRYDFGRVYKPVMYYEPNQ
jgi:ribosomal protein S18 acetylase RimI-like enzyme